MTCCSLLKQQEGNSMNKHYEFGLEDTRKRLVYWGEWCQLILTMGLDFPSKSIIGQLGDNKGVMIRSTGSVLTPENENAEEVDELVNLYAQEAPEQARVLSIQYATEGNTSNKIKQSQLSRRTYYRYLSSAESWINKHL